MKMLESTTFNAIVHEIKNPVALALAHVNLIRHELNYESPVYSHLNGIENALYDICDLVQSMLSDNTVNTIYGDLYEMDIHEMLNDMLEEYRVAFPNITFTFASANIEVPFYGQEMALRMIFSNLLKNAIEAVTERHDCMGQISVFAETTMDGQINISIRDNGISEFQKKPNGNGLGLSICNYLADLVGGKIALCRATGGGVVALVSLGSSIY